jgi:thymidylate kinase
MKQNEKTRECLIAHGQTYPEWQIQDVFKYLYQSAFGCEHLVSSTEDVAARIRREYAQGERRGDERIDVLDGAYSRVHLSCLQAGLDAGTLAGLFVASARPEPMGQEALERKLAVAAALVKKGELAFDSDEFDKAVLAWRARGYPPVHHSDTFRKCYQPSYRVIANDYLPFLKLFSEIDKKCRAGRVIVAIEGGSASGKSTLGDLLRSVYDCTVFHMDDFFLRPEQRTKERYAEVGGNVDRERFLEQVLIPLRAGKAVDYRRFDCKTMTVQEPICVQPSQLTVIEGAYSMHPDLAPYYDLSVFLDVDSELQRKRIEKRNSPPVAERFYREWIPLETKYFSHMQVKERCDLCVAIDE